MLPNDKAERASATNRVRDYVNLVLLFFQSLSNHDRFTIAPVVDLPMKHYGILEGGPSYEGHRCVVGRFSRG